jgi:hypothetical protein
MASSLLLKRAPSMSLMPMSYSYARVRWSIASAETPLHAPGQQGPLGRAGESREKGAPGEHRGNTKETPGKQEAGRAGGRAGRCRSTH